ncbi:Arginine--tRNA ligase, cytoplasmic [Paramyrothecium foliicola]|nr:Arginine--tRNA ligase, cytoplasmic [Paramyrothecium foliicola]
MSTLTLDGIAAILASLGVEKLPSAIGVDPDAHVLSRPIDLYRAYIADVLADLVGCEAEFAYNAIQTPVNLQNGDVVVPVPRLRLKAKKSNEQATEIAGRFPRSSPLIQDVAASGIHLPFFFTPLSLSRLILPYIFQRQSTFGNNPDVGLRRASSPGRKKLVVDFSSPNIAKEFHAGHLRSTIIGAYISNLHEKMGWDVVRLNCLGDWGKQFGLLAVGWHRYGSEEQLAREPLKHLDVYARINSDFKPEQEASKKAREEGRDTADIESKGLFAERNAFFKRMEDGDPEAVALWKRFRDISIERYVDTYSRLNISFDVYGGESQVKQSTVEAVEKILQEKGIYEEHNGSWIIDFKKHGAKALDVAVVRGRTGTTTYLLRDVAAALEREEQYGFDKAIYVVSSEQDIYFKRVFKTIEIMGRPDLAARLQHVNFGRVMGMSSRLGNVQLLSDILDQSSSAMHEVMRRNAAKYAEVPDPNAVAEAVGIAAVMVQDMSGERINNYPFDITRMTSFEGDTGPYLQYCHARLNSLQRKAGLTRDDLIQHLHEHPSALDGDLANKPHSGDLFRLMAQFPDVTATAMKTLEPSTILTYLFRLTHQLSSCYDVLQVVGAKEGRNVMIARAAMYEGARQVLENGMKLLGITPVDR